MNTDRCYNYLEEYAVLARILGNISLGALVDASTARRSLGVVNHTRTHDTLPSVVPNEYTSGLS